MPTKNVFISHIHEDDDLLPKLKDLVRRAGMEVRDGAINSDKMNGAQNEEYIKREILAPHIQWASVLIVLVTHETHRSPWVDWEIEEAIRQGKPIVGVYAQGATDADLPDALQKYGEAAVVGWQGARVVDAILGKIKDWDHPTGASAQPRAPEWNIVRVNC